MRSLACRPLGKRLFNCLQHTAVMPSPIENPSTCCHHRSKNQTIWVLVSLPNSRLNASARAAFKIGLVKAFLQMFDSIFWYFYPHITHDHTEGQTA